MNGGIYVQGAVDRMTNSIDAYGRTRSTPIKQGSSMTTITVNQSVEHDARRGRGDDHD